jgi:hypothetical protein
MGSIEVKVKKLDAELGVFKAQMAKMRDGPGKVSRSRRWRQVESSLRPDDYTAHRLFVLVLVLMLMQLERGASESAPDVEAEEAV